MTCYAEKLFKPSDQMLIRYKQIKTSEWYISLSVLCYREAIPLQSLQIPLPYTIFTSMHLLAYAEDIDIIGRAKQDVFSAIDRESAKVGL